VSAIPDTVLEVENLCKHYGSTQALKGLSFSVARGSFSGLFGRNGAGKTTTFDIITGLLGRDRGRVVLLDEVVGVEPSPGLKQRFAYVGGHLSLYHWLTVEEHLRFVSGFYPTWDEARCKELLDVFRLPMKQAAGHLSPGLHLQFQLLMALSRHPEVIIIDEPGNIDPVVRLRLMSTITQILREEQATIIMSSHLIDELEGICDHMCIIDQGAALMSGPVEALTAEAREVRLRGPNVAEPAPAANLYCRPGDDGALVVVLTQFSEGKAHALAAEMHAESYDVGPTGLQEFFIALTTERE
jgi:ABC-2 type transport system ATP-binding protein